jgi:hypothetical protein
MNSMDSAAHAAYLVYGMNRWAEAAAAHLEATSPLAVSTLRERLGSLGAFSKATFPQPIQSLPVLYMFSGSDLLTAYALFPHAPSYNLVADFPTGSPECFVDAACASRANESALAFFKHWANLRFARQSTNLMRRAFAVSESGQLPGLLLSLRLVGERVIYAETSTVSTLATGDGPVTVSGTNGHAGRGDGAVAIRAGAGASVSAGAGAGPSDDSSRFLRLPCVTLHTSRFRVTYTSMLLRSDSSEHVRLGKQDWPSHSRWARGGPFIDAQLKALTHAIGGSSSSNDGRLFVSMFKAAPHWILRNAWAAQWVLRHSAATLHDETGLRPTFYNASAGATSLRWSTVAHGAFREFENREVKWYPGEKDELKRLFHGPELPFQFGYAQAGGHGILLAAWRSEMA